MKILKERGEIQTTRSDPPAIALHRIEISQNCRVRKKRSEVVSSSRAYWVDKLRTRSGHHRYVACGRMQKTPWVDRKPLSPLPVKNSSPSPVHSSNEIMAALHKRLGSWYQRKSEGEANEGNAHDDWGTCWKNRLLAKVLTGLSKTVRFLSWRMGYCPTPAGRKIRHAEDVKEFQCSSRSWVKILILEHNFWELSVLMLWSKPRATGEMSLTIY